jgi:hypothetical protein
MYAATPGKNDSEIRGTVVVTIAPHIKIIIKA